jgi:hypothetical protein
MKLHIIGPMTGLLHHNFPAFHAAAKHLRSLGHEVTSAAELFDEMQDDGTPAPGTPQYKRETYMEAGLAHVRKSDAVLVLPGYSASDGTQDEIREAIEHHKTRYFYPRDVDRIPKPEVE